jgi:hypothetical protein
MHELQAREISLLRHSSKAVWAASPAMRSMRSNLDCSPEKAGAPISSHVDIRPAAGVGGGLQPWSTVLQTAWSGVAGVPVSLPPGASTLCRATRSAEDPSRPPCSSGRWAVVRVRRSAMGPLPDGAQTLPRQRRYIPRSAALAGKGRRFEVGTGVGRDLAERDLPHPSGGYRQRPRDAADRHGATMGSPALPLPPAHEIAGLSPRSALHAARRFGTRGDPPARPRRPGPVRRRAPVRNTQAAQALVARRLRHRACSSNGPRFPEELGVLSVSPHVSTSRLASDYQLRRVDVPPLARDVPKQPGWIKPCLRASVGHCLHSPSA